MSEISDVANSKMTTESLPEPEEQPEVDVDSSVEKPAKKAKRPYEWTPARKAAFKRCLEKRQAQIKDIKKRKIVKAAEILTEDVPVEKTKAPPKKEEEVHEAPPPKQKKPKKKVVVYQESSDSSDSSESSVEVIVKKKPKKHSKTEETLSQVLRWI